MDNQIFLVVQKAIANALEIETDSVSIDNSISDFSNWDSLGFVKVFLSLLGQFRAELDIKELVHCNTVKEICEYVEGTLAKGPH